MLIIIAQIIFALSVLGILFLIFRRIPDILKYPRHPSKEVSINGTLRNQWEVVKEKTGFSNFLHDIIVPETEKFLRKIKIILLKFDNFLARRIEKLRERVNKRRRAK